MGKIEHTPGPWYEDAQGRIRQKSSDAIVATMDDGGAVEAGVGVELSHAEIKANSHLIAAAPELLSALKALVNNINEFDGRVTDGMFIEQAFAAIARVTGDQS